MKNHTLTKSEMQLMNILWEMPRGGSVNSILEGYPEPRPAYTTVATFLKILLQRQIRVFQTETIRKKRPNK